MSNASCPRCGSSRIIPRVRVFDQGESSNGYLRVGVATRPQARLFKGWRKDKVWAAICGDCGHLEMSIDEPQKLYEAYQQASHS